MNYKKLAGAGMAAIGFIFFAVLVWPLFMGLGEAREAVESGQIALDQRKNILEQVRSLKKIVSTKKDSIDQLGTILPARKKIEEVVVNIEEAANQTGLSLRELKTAEALSPEQKNSSKILQVELSGSGSYQAVLGLFKSLEKNLRIFDIREFSVSLDTAGEATGVLNLNLKLLTYYLDTAKEKN